jgi:beta-glucanase (GH16 family)
LKIRYFILLIIFSYVHIYAQTWTLIWSDEFNNSNVDLSKWKYETGASGWGNNELENYTTSSENSRIENGNLLIIATKKIVNGTSNYYSARMKTQGLASFEYGKIEARIKLPEGQGIWPAFWMLGDNITQVGWPKCGEIDIMEHINNNSQINGTMHWDNNGHVSAGGTAVCDVTQYHVYSIVWDKNTIRWYRDDYNYYTGYIINNVNSTDEFHQPFFIILNLAVGGNWPGYPDSTTQFPDTMYVDYVRVYQDSSSVSGMINESIPNRYELLQNFPNPFNPKTTIQYSIPEMEKVKLTLFDTLGRDIETLVNEEKFAGNYKVEFNAENLVSGVYYYQLRAGDFIQTKKMILMK